MIDTLPQLPQLDRLKAMAMQARPKASKSSSTPDLHIAEAVQYTNKLPELIAAVKDAEDRKDSCTQAIIGMAEPQRVILARQQNANLTSIRVNGVLYLCAGPHFAKALKGARVAEVMELFGDRFDRYFTPRCKLPKALTPAQMVALDNAGIGYEVEFCGTDSLQIDRTLDDNIRQMCASGLPELPCMMSVRLK